MKDSSQAEGSRRAAAGTGEFLAARYFQVHFEYLHEQLSDASRQLAVLNDRVRLLEAQLGWRRKPLAIPMSEDAEAGAVVPTRRY
ncbi:MULTISPECIES: hypothetical protein [Methylomonas]|uniref:Uncharacterized protein n=1 Tax=Methylomonas koyamae TaxID=702114 RepID=A0A177NY85_9GAMM|nr:hypothetical protein [Methylomonas koyamae]OAI22975.1 hypothetical protein A1355_22070 [Methylomonas koyamae]